MCAMTRMIVEMSCDRYFLDSDSIPRKPFFHFSVLFRWIFRLIRLWWAAYNIVASWQCRRGYHSVIYWNIHTLFVHCVCYHEQFEFVRQTKTNAIRNDNNANQSFGTWHRPYENIYGKRQQRHRIYRTTTSPTTIITSLIDSRIRYDENSICFSLSDRTRSKRKKKKRKMHSASDTDYYILCCVRSCSANRYRDHHFASDSLERLQRCHNLSADSERTHKHTHTSIGRELSTQKIHFAQMVDANHHTHTPPNAIFRSIHSRMTQTEREKTQNQ